MQTHYNVYLGGEIHSDWRNEIISGCQSAHMNVAFSKPETDHDASDEVGPKILGHEEQSFWYDQKSARINSIRIRKGIQDADIVIIRFGEKYRQWNAAFDAGFASALGKNVIIIHPEQYDHALKEVDAFASAVARENSEVIEILKFICRE